MSLEMNKLVTRRFLEEVVNTGNVERLAEYISPDCRETNDPTGQAVGLASMRAHVLGVRQTYPDLHITVEQQIAEGDWVATALLHAALTPAIGSASNRRAGGWSLLA